MCDTIVDWPAQKQIEVPYASSRGKLRWKSEKSETFLLPLRCGERDQWGRTVMCEPCWQEFEIGLMEDWRRAQEAINSEI